MPILLTLTLTAIVAYYGVRLIWQFHQTLQYERKVAARLHAITMAESMLPRRDS